MLASLVHKLCVAFRCFGGLGLLASAGCGEAASELPACPDSGKAVPERLCEWGFFRDTPGQLPADGVVPYTVVSNLFTDDADKLRFIALPDGQKMTYDPLDIWGFPEGSAVIKTFAYPHDARDLSQGYQLVETRLLVFESGIWVPHVYRWNDAQTEATRFVPGTRVEVAWVDETGTAQTQPYRIPSTDDCKICHGGKESPTVLGLRTRQLDTLIADGAGGMSNQLDHFAALGLLDKTPEPSTMRTRLVDPFGQADVALRARAYLDGNCAHCHRQGGDAQSSGLWLNFENEDPEHYGVCKIPVAVGNGGGGLDFDIVPGDPDASILIFRMEHTAADIKMPELGGLAPDVAGTELMREWIAAMEPKGCGR
ncbi:MAG: hypothetical protein ACPG4T_04555 [Nannocystaceae bacterium]